MLGVQMLRWSYAVSFGGIKAAGAMSLPLVLIDVDARSLESRVDNSLGVQVFYWYLKMFSQCI